MGEQITKEHIDVAPTGWRFLQLLNDSAERLLAATDANQAVADLFRLIADELRLDIYVNCIMTEGGLILSNSFGVDVRAIRMASRLNVPVCLEVALERRPHYLADVLRSSEPRTAILRAEGVDCYACAPMMAGDRVIGTLGFGRRWSGSFTPEELQFLHTVTHYVAMALERLRTETALRESERRLNAVLDNASVAIFLMDDRQHCAYMNAAAEKLTGYTFEETLQRPLHDVIHHTRPDGSHFPLHECAIDRAFPENNHEQGEEVFVHKDGHFYPVAFTASPIRDEASKTIGTIIEVRDITQDKRNEQIRELLMREVDHRARNTLSVVQSIVQLTKASDIEGYREMVLGRISALGRAQGSLAAEHWEGASLSVVIADELDAMSKSGQHALDGPPVTLLPEQVQAVGMIVHELATNAVKYGALSRETGRVDIGWTTSPTSVDIEWRETGGPPARPPSRAGFGSRLIETLGCQLGADLKHAWLPEGLTVRLRLPR